MAVVEVTVDDFAEEVVEHKGETVFVDFWAEWCAPCKAIAPAYARLAEEVDAKFVKMNIEEGQALAVEYGVRSIPTFIAFRDGVEIARMVGTRNLDSFVDENL